MDFELEDNLEDYSIDLEGYKIILIGGSVYKERVRYSSLEFKEQATKEIYFESFEPLNHSKAQRDKYSLLTLDNKEKFGRFQIKTYYPQASRLISPEAQE
jgi:hypothetical protein